MSFARIDISHDFDSSMGFASITPIRAMVDIYVLYLHWFGLVVCFSMYLFILTRRMWVRICILSRVLKGHVPVEPFSEIPSRYFNFFSLSIQITLKMISF